MRAGPATAAACGGCRAPLLQRAPAAAGAMIECNVKSWVYNSMSDQEDFLHFNIIDEKVIETLTNITKLYMN